MIVNRNILSTVGCLFIYAALFIDDLIYAAGMELPVLPLLSLGLAFLLLCREARFSPVELFIGGAFAMLALVNATVSQYSAISGYLMAPLVALIASKTARSTLIALLTFHAALSVVVQAYEHLNQAYLFSVVQADGLVLDRAFFSGNAEVTRAKGLFQGPLSAVSFYLLVAVLNPRLLIIGIALMGAALAYGRLGIVLITVLFLARLLFDAGTREAMIWLLLALGCTLLVSAFIVLPPFFSSAFDLSSPGNVARIYFWKENILHFSEYSFLNMAFGNLGYASNIIGSTESDFIRILMDAGFLGLAFYLFSLALTFCRASRLGGEKILHLVIVFTAMSLFPLIQSFDACILAWLYIWGFFHGHEGGGNETKLQA